MSEIRRFDPAEDNFRNAWGMRMREGGDYVLYADHAAEVARLQQAASDEHAQAQRFVECLDMIAHALGTTLGQTPPMFLDGAVRNAVAAARVAALQEVREKVGAHNLAWKRLDAAEIYRILDEVEHG